MSPTIDPSTARALGALHDRLAAAGLRLRLAEAYPAVREELRPFARARQFGPLQSRLTVAEAVAHAASADAG